MTAQAGQTLSHYRLIEKIGEGGMGVVWRALDKKLGREVALKILPDAVSRDAERLARFEREARLLAALSHPNIVTVFSVEEDSGTRFITMELVQGRSLATMISEAGIPLGRLFELAIPLADAVAAAHKQGVIHRDLKPANVQVSDEQRVKVLDFGLAKLRNETAAGDRATEAPTRTATAEGIVLGTAAYMSPEQAEGKPADPRSDVFSLGIMLYEMSTGELPFKGDTPVSTITSILRDTPVSVTDLNPALPRHLGRIIKRCLHKDPTRRYQSALELRNELEELKAELDSGEPFAPGASPTDRRRGGWKIVLAAGLGAAVVVAALWTLGTILQEEAPATTTGPPRGVSFQRLTETAGHEIEPSLSPDGKWFVYMSDATGGGDVYLQAVGGSNPINLTADCAERDAEPAFSPDGERIAFRSEREGGGIFVMGRTGESVRRITDTGYRPAWSPDGTEIAFATKGFDDPRLSPGPSELWVVEVASGETRLVAEADAQQPHWSPSARRLAYWGLRPGSGS
ncbi:MAG: serine/threonine-protein kinase, partial [Acidobacteria bacterium]|nr:serine/threonine-protein kinase [Acidobacteriota bacterium]